MKLLILLLLYAAPARAAEAWLGLLLTDGAHGARVKEALAGSPGEKAGIAAGDEVLAVDEHATATPQALIDEVKRAGVGKAVKVRVLDHAGKPRTFTIRLESRPDMRTLQRTQLVGRPAPDFEPSVQAGGKLGKLSSLHGRVVLIDFFATWCGPCVVSMPHLEALHQKWGAKGLTVLGISTESSSIVAAAREKFNLSYSLASDENEGVSGSYRVFALPTMVVIDKKGIVREVAVNDEEVIDAALEKALK